MTSSSSFSLMSPPLSSLLLWLFRKQTERWRVGREASSPFSPSEAKPRNSTRRRTRSSLRFCTNNSLLLLTCLLLLVFPHASTGSLSDRPDEYSTTELEAEIERQMRSNAITDASGARLNILREFWRNHHGCKDTTWACQKVCRAQYPPFTGLCRRADGHEECFGVRVNYSYVREFTAPFPDELAVLRGLPRCWAVLGPLICSLVYRPCAVYEYMEKGLNEPGKIEVWQRFDAGVCEKAMRECAPLIEAGLFPHDVINCKDTVESAARAQYVGDDEKDQPNTIPTAEGKSMKKQKAREVFTDAGCRLHYNETTSRVARSPCIFPLVYAHKGDVKPLIDQCYLPCRSTVVSSSSRFDAFNIFRAALTTLCFISAFAIFVYLFLFSAIYEQHLSVFAVAHSLLSISLYLLLWLSGSFSTMSALAECSGPVRRPAHQELVPFEWCVISSFLLHFTFLSAYFWLAVAYLLSAAPLLPIGCLHRKALWTTCGGCWRRARGCGGNNWRGGRQYGTMLARPFILVSIYSTAVLIAILAAIFSERENDGIAGICAVGILSAGAFVAWFLAPAAVALVLAAILGHWRRRRENDFYEKRAEQLLRERLNEAETKEWDERRRENLRKRGIPDEAMTADRLADVDLEETDEEEEGKEKEEEEANGDGAEQQLNQGKKSEGGRRREPKSVLSEETRVEIEREVFSAERRRLREERAARGANSIGADWTAAAAGAAAVAILLAALFHLGVMETASKDRETDDVIGYVRCVLNQSIALKDIEWIKKVAELEEGDESNPIHFRDRLGSLIQPHSCTLEAWGDKRLSGLLLVFLLFPLAPFLVLATAFLCGVVGYCGMTKANIVRERFTRFQKEDGAEMKMLKTKRVERGGREDENGRFGTLPGEAGDEDEEEQLESVSVAGERAPFRSSEKLHAVVAPSAPPSVACSLPTPHHPVVPGHIRKIDLMQRLHEHRRAATAATTSGQPPRWSRPEKGQLVARHAGGSTVEEGAGREAAATSAPQSQADYASTLVTTLPGDTTTDRPSWTSDTSENMTSLSEHLATAMQGQHPEMATAAAATVVNSIVKESSTGEALDHLYLAGVREGQWQERCKKYGMRIGELSESLQDATCRLHISTEEQMHDALLLNRAAAQLVRLHNLVEHRQQQVEGADRDAAAQFAQEIAIESARLLEQLQVTLIQRAAGQPVLETSRQLLQRQAQQRAAAQQQQHQQPFDPRVAIYPPYTVVDVSAAMSSNPGPSGSTPHDASARTPPTRGAMPDFSSSSLGSSISPVPAIVTAGAFGQQQIRLPFYPQTHPAVYGRGQIAFAAPTAHFRAPLSSPPMTIGQAGSSAHFPNSAHFQDSAHFQNSAHNQATSSGSSASSPEQAHESRGHPGNGGDGVRPEASGAGPDAASGSSGRRSNDSPPGPAASSPARDASSVFGSFRFPSPTGSARKGSSTSSNSPTGNPPLTPDEKKSEALKNVSRQIKERQRRELEARVRAQMQQAVMTGGAFGIPPLLSPPNGGQPGAPSGTTPATTPTAPLFYPIGSSAAAAAIAAVHQQRQQQQRIVGYGESSTSSGFGSGQGTTGLNATTASSSSEKSHGGVGGAAQDSRGVGGANQGVDPALRGRRADEAEEDQDKPGPSGIQTSPSAFSPILRKRCNSSPSLQSSDSSKKSGCSVTSNLSPEEEARLIAGLRAALEAAGELREDGEEEGDPADRRLREHLRLAFSTQGGISRDDIMRWRLSELRRRGGLGDGRRADPYAVNSIVISRLSRRELEVRVAAIRSLSSTPLYPLEIFFQLQMADLVWLVDERDISIGDQIYAQDEINELLGTGPNVSPNTDPEDFQTLMRKRASIAAHAAGKHYGQHQHDPNYSPPAPHDLNIRTLGGSAALIAAAHGDFSRLREAIEDLPIIASDLMRLDAASNSSMGTSLRYFRDFLDRAAERAGCPLRPHTHAADETVEDPTAPERKDRDDTPPPDGI